MRLSGTILALPMLLAAQSPQAVKLTAVCADEEMTHFGLVCDEDAPCPVLLDLTDATMGGSRIFLTGNFYTGSTTLWSVLLASEDGGATWAEPWPRLLGAALDQVQFYDAGAGWAAGHMAGSIPRDPFLVLTADGGKTWKSTPVFNDSVVGVVEQFWFDSRETGSLVAERRGSRQPGRYQRMVTRAGGKTWTLQEARDEPIALKRPAVPASEELRIRADKRTKTLRVEKRAAASWAALAAFSLDAGACKAAPPKPPPPDPPPPKEPPR